MTDKQKIYCLSLFSCILVASTCYAFFLYMASHDSVIQLTAEVSQLKSKVEQIQSTSKLARHTQHQPSPFSSLRLGAPPPRSIDPLPAETQTKDDEKTTPDSDAKKPVTGNDWAVKFQMQRLEQFTGLTEDQRARLEVKFRAEQDLMNEGKWIKSEEDARENNIEPLSDILGPEIATQYQEEQKQAMERFKAEHTDQEVFTYARKLSLSEEQEDKVRASVEEVDKLLAEGMQKDEEEKQTDKSKSKDDPSSHIENFRKMREKRRELLNEKLRPFLTDDQYNRMLEDQATNQQFPYVF